MSRVRLSGKRPGQFKERPNQALGTLFVAPEHVEGTLRVGWEEMQGLNDPFARATCMMFLVSEVHPFDDGNGRLSRMMMNSELAQAGATQILVPTVLRIDYMSALIALTHNGRADGLIEVLDYAQRYTAQVDFSDFQRTHQILDATNAFVDSGQAERRALRLLLPSSLPLGWESADPIPSQNEDRGGSFMDTIDALDAGDRSATLLRKGDIGATIDRGQFAAVNRSAPEATL